MILHEDSSKEGAKPMAQTSQISKLNLPSDINEDAEGREECC
jgi:hypothetical protein